MKEIITEFVKMIDVFLTVIEVSMLKLNEKVL